MIKDTYIRARVDRIEKEKYMKLADRKGVKLSDLIRRLLEKEI